MNNNNNNNNKSCDANLNCVCVCVLKENIEMSATQKDGHSTEPLLPSTVRIHFSLLLLFKLFIRCQGKFGQTYL